MLPLQDCRGVGSGLPGASIRRAADDSWRGNETRETKTAISKQISRLGKCRAWKGKGDFRWILVLLTVEKKKSFSNEQHGDFDLELRSIAAASARTESSVANQHSGGQHTDNGAQEDEEEVDDLQKPVPEARGTTGRHTGRRSGGSPWWRGVLCGLL